MQRHSGERGDGSRSTGTRQSRAGFTEVARMISTNPVVVRRMMAGLREKEILISEKGHGGGWHLARPLSAISLRDVYEAIGSPPLFNIGPGADPADCLVEKAVDARLELAMQEAERRLLQQFSEIAVEDLAQDFEQRFAALQADADDNPAAAFSHIKS
ncbi:RrF2 family transcriptional regulator [Martelella mangrovi]